MTKRIFLSFHYDGDVSRVQAIRNMGLIEGDSVVSPQKWEDVKGGGEQGIKDWIDAEMKGKSAVVVLVGGQTASRKWVQHEIAKAWEDKRPLVGIRIHGLKDLNGNVGTYGVDPFTQVTDSGTPLSAYLDLHNPSGADSKAVYASIKDNLDSWVAGAVKRA